MPPAKQPLDAGFHCLPERLLDELAERGNDSLLARLGASVGDRVSIGAGHADRPLADVEREQTRAVALGRRDVGQQLLEVAQDRQDV